MQKTLFHIAEDIELLIDSLANTEDGDLEAEILSYLEDAQQELKQKLDNYAEYIQELEARAAARKQRAKEMAELAKADESLAKRLKTTLQYFFESEGLKRQDTDRHRIILAKNGGKLPIVLDPTLDPMDLPREYQEVIYKADTDAIRQALESGKDLPFAFLGDRGQSIRIK